MSDCPVCGTDSTYEITTLEQVEPSYVCHYGHRYVEVRFRPARWYMPPLHYIDPSDMEPMVATFIDELTPTMSPPPVRSIHCGPPADLPAVPTPDDILRGAGLEHLAIPTPDDGPTS